MTDPDEEDRIRRLNRYLDAEDPEGKACRFEPYLGKERGVALAGHMMGRYLWDSAADAARAYGETARNVMSMPAENVDLFPLGYYGPFLPFAYVSSGEELDVTLAALGF